MVQQTLRYDDTATTAQQQNETAESNCIQENAVNDAREKEKGMKEKKFQEFHFRL